MDDLIARIADGYGLAVAKVLPAQNGYRNHAYPLQLRDGRTLNLMLYKTEPGMLARIRRANTIADFAAARGLPARHTCSPRIAQLSANGRQKFGALYTYLPGQTIPWESYTRERIKNLGGMLSRLHAVLTAAGTSALPDVTQECHQLNRRMLRYFADSHVQTALRQKLGLCVRAADYTIFLRHCQQLPGTQALHMDFVRGNILFRGATITGILDFEKTARGNPLFDIARSLAFLLVDCKYTPAGKVKKYFLQSGYQKRGQAKMVHISINGRDVLATLTDFFLLHDFYKFLRHNPYEYLPQNEHFTRTQLLLLQRGLIAPSKC